ncbi:transporter substrate-binding domain-containing protein [uncultured Phascolarctobacterium sp.]|uniref:transporter substrate-binding domain-containing protein n=1 Tax=uncultured Phascolarctobacterium sp. TaxID=512296 RepID=UPI0025FBFBDB|nr:transporter substrate-binding domain-containing protein [uncultured Phascolarctobacterium sp.]
MLKKIQAKLLLASRALLVFCCTLFILLTTIAPAAGEPTHERRTVRVGVLAQDGLCQKDANGRLHGYTIDLWTMANRYMDVKVEYVGYGKSWNELLQMLQNDELDILTNAQKSPEREQIFTFTKPTGITSGLLNVRAGNTKFVAGDYATYNGMRIGTFRKDRSYELFQKWAQEKGFTYQTTFYDTSHELYAAFHRGKVEAIIANSFRRPANERTLDLFYTNNIYGIVRKDDTQLLNEFNYAIDQMNASEGDWIHRLIYKYVSDTGVSTKTFSQREQELIRQYQSGEKKLVVGVWTDRAPLSYVEDGQLKGILPELFAKIMQKAGIPYTIKLPKDKADYEKMYLDGSVDVIMDWRNDSIPLAEERDYALSTKYLDTRIVLLKRNTLKEQPHTFAVERTTRLSNVEEKLVDDASVFLTNNVDESVRAVAYGKADATYLYYYMALYYLNKGSYKNLVYEILDQPGPDMHIAFTAGVSHEMSGIISKCISQISNEERTQIINKYTTFQPQDMDFATYITYNPQLTLLFFFIILAISLGFLLMYMRLHEKKRLLAQEQAYAVKQEQLAEAAEAASKSKTSFLFNMSHDIRTPMNAIIGFANLAQNAKCSTEQMHNYLSKILVASQHLLSLINDILEMSRIESGKITLEPVPTSWSEIMQELHTIIQEQIESKKQSFTISIAPLTHDYVMIDKLRMEQVLVNLVSNASKYTPEHGSISVKLAQAPAAKPNHAIYKISVMDNGMGMSEDFVKKIFSPFERANSTTVSQIQGTGLGMSITKSIIDLANGTIDVKSKLGEGTEIVVTVTLCLCTDAEIATLNAKQLDNPQAQAEQPDFKGKRLLVVEDNKLNREITVTILEQTGILTEQAEDGSVAVKMVQEAAPGYYDLILMDIQMPIMDGYEATKQIRALPDKRLAQLPIIAVSANAFEEDKKASLAAGMDGHIAKPINVPDLFALMQKLIK